MKKYSKNFVLCGEIDFHCILCQESFINVEQVEKHIRWEKHRKLIKNQSLVSKFRKDSIYKVGTSFYCEFCNLVLENAEVLATHLQDDDHKANKADPEKISSQMPLAKWDGNKVIIDNKINIGIDDWHGVIKKFCHFCDITIKDVDDHIPSTAHMIKLIPTIVKYENEVYFKKVNQNVTFCYECKKLYKHEDFPDHVLKKHSEHAKVMSIVEDDKKYFDVDEKNNSATCKICKQTLACTSTVLYNHKQSHLAGKSDDVPEVTIAAKLPSFFYVDHGKRRADLKEYGKDHFIKLNRGGSKGYCSLCNMYISAHMDNFKQHVKGMCHKGHLELKGLIKKTGKPEKIRYKTKPLKQYLTQVYYTKDSASVLINNDISILMLNFLFLVPLYESVKFKCFICDIMFPMAHNEHYAKGSGHAERFVKADVVTSIKGEFVRLIQPGLFHCGFCNQVYPNFKLLEKHLKSWQHTFSKAQSKELYDKAIESQLNDAQDQYREFLNTLDIMS